MDTPTTRKATKKGRLREKYAIAGTTTTENMPDPPTEPPPSTTINLDNLEHPSEAIAHQENPKKNLSDLMFLFCG
jgi:hypothetical protein